MNMKMTDLFKHAAAAACIGVFFVAPVVLAQNEEEPPANGGEDAAKPAEAAVDGGDASAQKPDKFFYPLVRCEEVRGGTIEVRKPREDGWTKAEEKKFYPLGSAFRVKPGVIGPTRVSMTFGIGSRVLVTNAAEFATREIAIGETSRVLELREGFIEVSLPRNLKDGLFSVAAPHFTCYNMAGDSRFNYTAHGDGDEAVIRVVTGSLAVKGRHYDIGQMGAANQIRIRNTKDALFTSIRGESGDCLAKLDRGLLQQKDYETGEIKENGDPLLFQLSPLCAIKIFRKISEIGGRMSVSLMTFAANGQMTHRWAFAEKRSNVNSGELIVSTNVIKDKDRKANDADAEVTEDVDVAVPAKADNANAETPADAANNENKADDDTGDQNKKKEAAPDGDDF